MPSLTYRAFSCQAGAATLDVTFDTTSLQVTSLHVVNHSPQTLYATITDTARGRVYHYTVQPGLDQVFDRGLPRIYMTARTDDDGNVCYFMTGWELAVEV